ncbi:MAG: CHAT domain-containing protein, partial [Bacteroidota bacterium]
FDNISDFYGRNNIDVIVPSRPDRYKSILYSTHNRLNIVKAEETLAENRNRPEVAATILSYLCVKSLHPDAIIANKSVRYCEEYINKKEEPVKAGIASEKLIDEAHNNLILGLSSLREGEFDAAYSYLKLVEKEVELKPEEQSFGGEKGYLGDFYFEIGEYRTALKYYDEYWKLRSPFDGQGGWDNDDPTLSIGQPGTRLNYALSLLRTGKHRQAEKILSKEIEAFENTSESGLGLSDLQAMRGYSNYGDRLYSALQELKVRQKKYEDALIIAERGKARDLLLRSHLAYGSAENNEPSNELTIKEIKEIAKSQNSTIIHYSIIPKGMWHGEELFIWVISPNGKIHFKRLDPATSQTSPKSNGGGIAGLLKSLLEKLQSLSPGRRESKSNGEDLINLNLDFMRLLEVNSLHIAGVSRGPIAEFADNSVCEEDDCLKILHSILIEPIESFLPKDPSQEIVVIPHRDIYKVPFYALKKSDTEYLIESHTLRFSPSIKLLKSTREVINTRTDWPSNSIVVGNPEIPKIKNIFGRSEIYESLDYAEFEAQMISKYLNSEALIGRQATESKVKESIRNAGIVHLATHGLLDSAVNENKVANALTFSPTDEDDGLLFEDEIYEFGSLNSYLVVLSACNTAVGDASGEGLLSLARAFMALGTPSVLASLWYVPDGSTSELMIEFYENIERGVSASSALRNAMLSVKEKDPDNIKAWANFMLIGESKLPISSISDDFTMVGDNQTPLSLTAGQLENAEYSVMKSPDGNPVKLTNGSFLMREPYFMSVNIGEIKGIGDLNSDGKLDAIITLEENGGGSGIYVNLVAVINENGEPKPVSIFTLGDRKYVNSLDIQNGKIEIQYITHGEGDPLCCPSK